MALWERRRFLEGGHAHDARPWRERERLSSGGVRSVSWSATHDTKAGLLHVHPASPSPGRGSATPDPGGREVVPRPGEGGLPGEGTPRVWQGGGREGRREGP